MSNDCNNDLRMLGMVGRLGAEPGVGVSTAAKPTKPAPLTDDERTRLALFGMVSPVSKNSQAAAPATLARVTQPSAEDHPRPEPDSYRMAGSNTAGDIRSALNEGGLCAPDPAPVDYHYTGEHPILGAVRELLEAGETISGIQVLRGGRRVLLGMRVAWEEEGD